MLEFKIFEPQNLKGHIFESILSIFIIKSYSPAIRCNLLLTVSHSSSKLLGLHILKADKNEGN